MGHRLRRAAGAVLVFAVSICASPPPFSWEAHEGHEIAISAPTSARNGAGHVSHVAETGSHQTRVTPSNVCAVSEAVSEVGTNQKATGFSPWLAPLAVLTVVFVFMLGWYCGRQQALSSFALQQAAQEDEQAKAHEAAKAAAPAVTSVIHAAIEAPANNEQTHDSIADAISLSSADSSFEYVQSSEADSGPAADSAKDPHTSSTSAAEPCHSRFQCSHQAQVLQHAPQRVAWHTASV